MDATVPRVQGPGGACTMATMSSLTWEDRAPFLDAAGRRRVHARFLGCGPAIEKAFRLPSGAIRRAKKLGCGYYGCAYLLPKQPESHAVVKVTSDPLEANAVRALEKLKKKSKLPAGVLRLHGVRELGKCAVKGRDVRTLWAIWREELDDAWPHVRERGVKLREFDALLEELADYMELRAGKAAFGPERSEVRARLGKIEGQALLEACEWLMEHGLFALDVVKPDNIGWRQGTGLVIRDIGATEAERDVRKEIARVGGASGAADYRGGHRAPSPSYGAPLHDLTLGDLLPPDIYSADAPRLYGHGGGVEDRARDRAVFEIVWKYRNKPDRAITIYRAVPKGVTEIHPGDWVTIYKPYAAQHARGHLERGAQILALKVRARDLWTNGDSIYEWGYHPAATGSVPVLR